MNGKEHTCVWNLVILLAEGTSRRSEDDLTMHELAGWEKLLMMIIKLLLLWVLSVPTKISIQVPFSLCMHLLFSWSKSSYNEWALGAMNALFLGVESFVVFLFRPCGLRLTRWFCAQNMKVQFIFRCIWAKCVCLVYVYIFKTDMKKRDFFIYFLVAWCAIFWTRMKICQCYSEVWKVSIEWM